MDDPILTTDDSRPLRVLGYAGLWADTPRSMIAPPASTWVRGPLARWCSGRLEHIKPPPAPRKRGAYLIGGELTRVVAFPLLCKM